LRPPHILAGGPWRSREEQGGPWRARTSEDRKVTVGAK